MKIEESRLDRDTIEDFADKNNLVMEVCERSQENGPNRFYALFKNSNIKVGITLHLIFGNGHTSNEAMADYADKISNKLLIINANTIEQLEIVVPILNDYPSTTIGGEG